MPDFTPNFVTHSEIIGDSSSSEYNLGYNTERFTYRNASTNIVSKTIMNVLDFFLIIILVPFTACQRAYENDHLMVMIRVIFEVALELIMWLVLAGVSILTSAALIFDDLYCGKSGSDGYRRLVKNCTDETIIRDESGLQSSAITAAVTENNFSSENQSSEETVVQSSHDNQDWLASPFPQNDLQQTSEKTSKPANSFDSENNDESVNFSFYKPLRHGFVRESYSDRKQKK